MIEQFGKVKRLVIITLDENSKIIFQDKLTDSKRSNQYYSYIANDLVDSEGIREITLETKNERGEILTQHSFRQGIDSDSIYF